MIGALKLPTCLVVTSHTISLTINYFGLKVAKWLPLFGMDKRKDRSKTPLLEVFIKPHLRKSRKLKIKRYGKITIILKQFKIL